MAVAAHPLLQCPACRKRLEDVSWRDAGGGSCRYCQTDFTFLGFPALHAAGRPRRPRAVRVEGGATCFFHEENRADHVCGQCGRYVCPVCAVDMGAGVTCPACLASARQAAPEAVAGRLLYDRLALGLAVLPLLLWPFTLVTAPVAVGFAVVGWRKPGSLVGGTRVRLVLALGLGLAQVAGWALLASRLWFGVGNE